MLSIDSVDTVVLQIQYSRCTWALLPDYLGILDLDPRVYNIVRRALHGKGTRAPGGASLDLAVRCGSRSK